MFSARQIHERFATLFSSGDLNGLVALYEPDAVLNTSTGPVTGSTAIRAALEPFLTGGPKMEIKTVGVFENKGLALLHGEWVITGKAPDGSTTRTQGHNTELARYQPDGSWLFVIDNPFAP
jgi:uncharacterized protein (TIGR02246 family)